MAQMSLYHIAPHRTCVAACVIVRQCYTNFCGKSLCAGEASVRKGAGTEIGTCVSISQKPDVNMELLVLLVQQCCVIQGRSLTNRTPERPDTRTCC